LKTTCPLNIKRRSKFVVQYFRVVILYNEAFSTVVVDALCYKSEGRWFETR
jgi:hypothetical protein